MNDIQKKIVDFLRQTDGLVKMQTIADAVGMDKVAMYNEGLKQLVGDGTVERIVENRYTFYRLSRARVNEDERVTRVDNNKNIIYLNNNIQEKCLSNTRVCAESEKQTLYPANVEEIVSAAEQIGYRMSLFEAAKFLALYGSVGWIDQRGLLIRKWQALLPYWQTRQSASQYAAAKREADRRSKGLPPVDQDTKEYEYYEDAQGRKWRKHIGESDWENIPEEITFSDGLTSIKGVC